MQKALRRWFRSRRNKGLAELIARIHAREGRPVSVLDVGGSPFFWETVGDIGKAEITLLNLEESRNRDVFTDSPLRDRVKFEIGDGTDIRHPDKSFDLVVCNSVIEHVGLWPSMKNIAAELERVGVHGWVQVPAYGFPVEPHFKLPFVHWFGQPTRGLLLRLFGGRRFRRMSPGELRSTIEGVNLLSKHEFVSLFGKGRYHAERLVLTKSHLVSW